MSAHVLAAVEALRAAGASKITVLPDGSVSGRFPKPPTPVRTTLVDPQQRPPIVVPVDPRTWNPNQWPAIDRGPGAQLASDTQHAQQRYADPVILSGAHGHACGPGCPCSSNVAFSLGRDEASA